MQQTIRHWLVQAHELLNYQTAEPTVCTALNHTHLKPINLRDKCGLRAERRLRQ